MKSIAILCAAMLALLPAASLGSVQVTPNELATTSQGLRALGRKPKKGGKGSQGSTSPGRGPQCGIPINKCKDKNGRCMPKEECFKQLGNMAGWVPGKDLCKMKKPNEECGCCYKRKPLREPEEGTAGEGESGEEPFPEDAELVPQGIAMAVEDQSSSSGARLEFSWSTDGLGDIKVMGLQDGWSFHSRAGTTAKLECDEKSCHAHVDGEAFHAKLDEYFAPIGVPEPKDSHGRLLETHATHIFTSQMVPSTIKLQFPNSLNNELLESLHKEPSQGAERKGRLDFTLELNPTEEQQRYVKPQVFTSVQWPYQINWRLVVVGPVKIFPPVWLVEKNKNLCVQPVRTRYRACLFKMFGICWIRSPTYTYSGDGLAFGRPGADEQWGKVDITFTWRPWITIDDTTGKYQSLTEGAEMSDLRSEVNVDDCVEVFFVKKFSPSSTYGGGACWSSGTANAKIISSDEQVSCGVDKTHLAHELGHALGLMHPGTGHATLPDGSSGTLLCGSGWQRDNPRRNSRDNGNNVVNPLLITYWSAYDFDSHECTNNADCGSCSAHIPSDSC